MSSRTDPVRPLPPSARKRRPLKRLLREVRRWTTGILGVGLNSLLGAHGHDQFGILMYHRVAPWDGRGSAPTWNVTPDRFHQQLAGLLRLGYEPWPLRRVLDHSRDRLAIPRKAFVVTFDDGYANVHTRAWPVLRELNVPATVFLATAFLDSTEPFPFDDWPAAGSPDSSESWLPLTTEQAQAMQASGLVELGSHTHTHARFRGRSEALAADLEISRRVMHDRFGVAEPTFAFPFGIGGPELLPVVRRSGLCCALTTHAAVVRTGSDPFGWGRFTVEQRDTAAAIAAQLGGWCSLTPDKRHLTEAVPVSRQTQVFGPS